MMHYEDTVQFEKLSFVFEDTAFPKNVDVGSTGFVTTLEKPEVVGIVNRDAAGFLSLKHNRSYVFWKANNPESAAVDEHGTKYYTATAKGAVHDPLVEFYSYETDGFRVYGLQNVKDGTAAILKSQYLRSVGVDMEWIFAASFPRLLPRPGVLDDNLQKLIPVRDFMDRLYRDEVTGYSLEPHEIEAIKNYQPLVTYRLQRSGLRPWDLKEQLQPWNEGVASEQYMGAIFEDLGPVLAEIGLMDKKIDELKRSDGEKILECYFMDYFPKRLAATLIRFWSLGFTHNYLHGGNVDLSGAIVDSESITGPFPWIEQADTESYYMTDLSRLCYDLDRCFDKLQKHIGLGEVNMGHTIASKVGRLVAPIYRN